MGCKLPNRFLGQGLLLLLLLIAIVPIASAANPNFTPAFDFGDEVHVNTSYILQNNATTPFDVWVVAALLGLVLFLLTIQGRQSVVDLERDLLISIMAWVPIGFTAYSSWAVERLSGYGVTGLIESQAPNGAINVHEYVLLEQHVIYHFDIIGVIYAVFFIVAIVNTLRILALHRALKAQGEQEKENV